MVWGLGSLINIVEGSCPQFCAGFGRFVRFWAGSGRVLLFAFGRVFAFCLLAFFAFGYRGLVSRIIN